MVIAQAKDSAVYFLIYNEAVLALHSDDKLIFKIENQYLNFTLVFDFDNNGEAFSTTTWEYPDKNTLQYLLHKWESSSWVEINNPVLLTGDDLTDEFYLKFRSYCPESSTHRKFEISVWRYEKGENENDNNNVAVK